MSILALAASRNNLAAASSYAASASLSAQAATEVARAAFSAAIAAANADLAAAHAADADAWGAAQDAARAAEQAEMAIVALLMAERMLRAAAERGGDAYPSDASKAPARTLAAALAEAAIDGAECEDQIEALRAMLRLAIAELMRSEAAALTAYGLASVSVGEEASL